MIKAMIWAFQRWLLLTVVLLVPVGADAAGDTPSGFGKFHLESGVKPWSYSSVVFPDGVRGEKFELRAGDCQKIDCKTDRERVEKIQDKSPALGKDLWVAWSVYLPANFPRQGRRMYTKIGQWHLPKHHGKGQGPNVLFEVSDECLQLTVKDPRVADIDPMHPAPNMFNKCIVSRKMILGHWTRYMVNAKWSTGVDGYLRVFVNGTLTWSYQGQTVNVPVRPYFRYGLYRSFVSRCGAACPTQIAYYRNLRQGRTREQVE